MERACQSGKQLIGAGLVAAGSRADLMRELDCPAAGGSKRAGLTLPIKATPDQRLRAGNRCKPMSLDRAPRPCAEFDDDFELVRMMPGPWCLKTDAGEAARM